MVEVFESTATLCNADQKAAEEATQSRRRIEDVILAEAKRVNDLGLFARGLTKFKVGSTRESVRWTLRDRINAFLGR